MDSTTEIMQPNSRNSRLRVKAHSNFASVNNAPRRKDSVAIFLDYDDTLLASSYLAFHGCLHLEALVPEDVAREVASLSEFVCPLLQLALDSASVFIVTNSETGWVNLSAHKFMPPIIPFLQHVTIISARSLYENKFPGKPFLWKKQAFNDCVHICFNNPLALSAPKTFLAMGDSTTEREAIIQCGKEIENTRVKNIKFVEHPSVEQLKSELDLVTKCFAHLLSFDNELDLTLQLQPQANGCTPFQSQFVPCPISPEPVTTPEQTPGTSEQATDVESEVAFPDFDSFTSSLSSPLANHKTRPVRV